VVIYPQNAMFQKLTQLKDVWRCTELTSTKFEIRTTWRGTDLQIRWPCSIQTWAGALAVFLFHFQLFSDAFPWVSCKM